MTRPHIVFPISQASRAAGPGRPSLSPRARFWDFVNGEPVKVSLDYGQTLCWGQSRPGEEGWGAEWIRWEHRGKDIFRIYVSAGRDCDGRYEQETRTLCPVERLRHRAVQIDSDGPTYLWPDWDKVSYYQRDDQAERAGY